MYSSNRPFVEDEIDRQYRGLHQQAVLGRLIGCIIGHSRPLPSLAQATEGCRVCGQRQEGLKTVPLSRIVGSEGRCKTFDRDFRPLKTHTQERWYRVARAYLGRTGLPPVELIRIGDAYYVRDGNHRVSVARAFGQTFIEAKVTEYQLTPHAKVEAQTPRAGRATEQAVTATA